MIGQAARTSDSHRPNTAKIDVTEDATSFDEVSVSVDWVVIVVRARQLLLQGEMYVGSPSRPLLSGNEQIVEVDEWVAMVGTQRLLWNEKGCE